MQDYLACVQGVDDNVGKLLDYLDDQGLTENTIVMYSADNGWYLGDLGLYDKRFMYEPGLRVPLIARGPGIKPGSTPGQFVANIDLAPTFLDLAGLEIPDSMQGRSLAPLLRGEQPADWRQAVYYRYYHDPGHHDTRAHYGVRTATHKLIHYWRKDAWELFDLRTDPTEQHNLLFDPAEAARPEVATVFAELKAEIARLNLSFEQLPPRARAAAESSGLELPITNSFRSIVARGIEIVAACEEAIRLVQAAAAAPLAPCRVAFEPRDGVGCHATEAPRGLLYHRYEIGADGLVKGAVIVPPTSQNQGQVEADLRDMLPGILNRGDEEVRHRCEHLIRNYDPCISCATHFLRLEIERA